MAQRYTIVLDIDEESLGALLAAGTRLVVARPAGGARPNVAWLACRPEAHNTIAWSEVYGIYAAPVPGSTGEPIVPVDIVSPARDGRMYRFSGTAFEPAVAAAEIPRGQYDVINDGYHAAAFGLMQRATVNDADICGPVNVTVLPPTFRASFAAMLALYVWTDRDVGGGSISPSIPPEATRIVLDPRRPSMRFRYERDAQLFAPLPKGLC